MIVPATTHAAIPPPGGTRMVRNILEDAPAPPRPHAFIDAGAAAVAIMTIGLFIAAMAFWAVEIAGPGSGASAGFEVRMLLWSVSLALLLPLLQIYLQITRFGGAAVRGNRARFPASEGAAGRVARAHRNLIESLIPFAVAVLAAHGFGISTRWTVAASAMFLAARVIHATTYALGVTVIRSAAFYAGLVATVILIASLPLLHA